MLVKGNLIQPEIGVFTKSSSRASFGDFGSNLPAVWITRNRLSETKHTHRQREEI